MCVCVCVCVCVNVCVCVCCALVVCLREEEDEDDINIVHECEASDDLLSSFCFCILHMGWHSFPFPDSLVVWTFIE